MDKSLADITKLLKGELVGDGSIRITGLSGLEDATAGDISFLGDPRYESFLQSTQASAVLVPRDCLHNGRAVIHVDSPHMAFAMLLKELEREVLVHPTGVHAGAVIADSARVAAGAAIDAFVHIEEDCEIGENVVLYSGVYVGKGSSIGPDTIVYPNTTIRERCRIGARCIIHSNVAIGGDGFGFTPVDGRHVKIPQVGTVEIGDDVEIGANSAVDRAVVGATRIGTGTKIDNLVQIAHNVSVGEHCTISGACAFAGSVKIGNHVTIGGMSGVNGHVEIGDNAIIAGNTGVVKSVGPGEVVSGFPDTPHRLTLRIWAAFPKLPQALRDLKRLKSRVDRLEE